MGVRIGYVEFDALAPPFGANIGWVELDCLSPDAAAVPVYRTGGGVSRYHSHAYQQYDIPLDAGADDEEEVLMNILMEIAAHVL